MKPIKLLILTDHSKHSQENSLYTLVQKFCQHPLCASVHIASRGNPANESFFYDLTRTTVWVHKAKEDFDFQVDGRQFVEDNQQSDLAYYDRIFIRLPHPVAPTFFNFLEANFLPEHIVNRPSGILETGSKAFLLHFKEWCAPIKWCETLEDILEFKKHFPIVLKPAYNYGGKGIVKIEGEKIVLGNQIHSLTDYLPLLEENVQNEGYLAMQYLKNVQKGDKRVIVVNGQIIGASLRLPPAGSWLCNAAQGGSSNYAIPDKEEVQMTQVIAPILKSRGVIMFGFDTLVGDDGKRKLSEINTMSIGGIKQAAQLANRPLVKKTVDLLMGYFLEV